MSRRTSRRNFLQASAAVGFGYWATAGASMAQSTSPNEQIQIAGIGWGGKGKSDVSNAAKHGKVVAICDSDRKFLENAGLEYDTDKLYTDYREMFDKLEGKIDAVTISTPDHTHAVIAAAAMNLGIHVYCQKPLTRTIWEARRLGEIAAAKNVVTQMGNQWTSYNPVRKTAAQIKAGQLGAVKELHVWTNRPVWPQGKPRPTPIAVPATLDWDSWIGPAPMRPYGDGYHTFEWRGWWDFGTGALGDMACHTCNLPFMALNMRDPVSVEAETSGHNGDSFPVRSKIKFEFPQLGERGPFTLYWYDGGNKPEIDLFSRVTITTKDGDGNDLPPPAPSGSLIIGDKGTLYAAGDYAELGMQVLDTEFTDVDYPRIAGGGDSAHNKEFFDCIKDRSKTPTSNFPNFAGPLTETILLGNLSVWKGGPVKWDAKTMTPDDPALKKIVKPEYQNGYAEI